MEIKFKTELPDGYQNIPVERTAEELLQRLRNADYSAVFFSTRNVDGILGERALFQEIIISGRNFHLHTVHTRNNSGSEQIRTTLYVAGQSQDPFAQIEKIVEDCFLSRPQPSTVPIDPASVPSGY